MKKRILFVTFLSSIVCFTENRNTLDANRSGEQISEPYRTPFLSGPKRLSMQEKSD
jgi:hypothetical protein